MTSTFRPALPDPYPIAPLRGPFNCTFAPPGSKSLTNRALLIAALADGTSTLHGALTDADDAQRMIIALRRLGATIDIDAARAEVRIQGVNGRWRTPKKGILLELENAGTAVRFLTAAAILGSPGTDGITIDGNTRMRERPLGELIDLLTTLGATCTYLNTRGFPPVRIDPIADLNTIPDAIEVPTTLSSQFISALILLAPHLPRGLTIRFTGEVTSASYIRMTTALLRSLGATIDGDPPRNIRIHPGPPRAQTITIEPDASSATYFFAATALTPGATYTCPGLVNSLQSDAAFPNILRAMSGTGVPPAGSKSGASVPPANPTSGAGVPPASVGASRPGRQLILTGPPSLTAITADLSDMPDAAMTLAAVACFAKGATTITGLRTLRVKETDRIEAIRAELTKLGVRVDVLDSGSDIALRITPPPAGIDCSPDAPPITFDTYRDHRMAMSLALIGLRRPNVFIRDPSCVGKTYPGFWDDLSKLKRCAT